MTTDKINATIKARLSRGANMASTTVHKITAPVKTGYRVLDGVDGHAIKRGCVVDIVGTSGSGKTRFLHGIIASLLSSPPPPPPYFPRVCWFDLNGGLDVRFLRRIVSQRLNRPLEDVNFVLNALRIYNPSSTASMCESILRLPEYFQTVEGSNVNAVVIDALGSFYYFDKFDADHRAAMSEPPADLQLLKAVRGLQATGHVATYITKCALFESEKLAATWPKDASFSAPELPSIPRDIMPKVWQTVTTHVILLYHVANEPETIDVPGTFASSGSTSVTRRGMIAMAFVQANRTGSRQLTIYSTSVLQISDGDIVC